ncbi:MAG: fibronectin type III domain-containing protein, partial [Fulvivirga sp.]|nr:fibronectin type III domain-containing protein [Fulvivirga sp.]
MKKLLTILFFLTCADYYAEAQTYPVSASTQLIPPYSTYLADYVALGSNKLALNIFLGDLNRQDLQIRLRLRIEGNGIRVESKPEYLPPPILLQGGVPERLTAADLEPYFRPENLNFQGITRQQFEQTGQLPEGLYQFCFEVLAYNRGVKISNTACAMAWLILNDPPIINLPRNSEKLKPQLPQYVTFQWTPRHTGSPNSAFATEYEFSLVEIWPENRNPNDAILTTPSIYETTTQSTTLIYGPDKPPLEPGRHYAFRVRAKAMTGFEELDLFKNQGYSQVHTFVYGDACLVPGNIEVKTKTPTRFKLRWETKFNHTEFKVRYRKKGNDKWTEDQSYFEELEVHSLLPNTSYEYQVAATCGAFISDYSTLATIHTDELPDSDYACGTGTLDFDLDNTELLESLNSGEYIHAGDFDIKVDSASGANGIFSGRGKAQVPFLNFVKVRTVFENITINTDHRVIDGNIYTYWDPESSMMMDEDVENENSGLDDDSQEEGEKQDNDKIDSIDSLNIDSPIDTLFTGDDGVITVITEAGDSISVNDGEEIVLTDPSGRSTTIPPPGGVDVGGNNNQNNGAGNNT